MRDSLIDLVRNHVPLDNAEKNSVRRTLEFLADNEDCVSKANLQGHVTASAWILSIDMDKTLLTHHKKLNRWLQLGGHIENDKTIQQAASREAFEESGIGQLELIQQSPFDVDVHKIPARGNTPAHYHYDMRFLLLSKSMNFTKSDESNDLAWVPLTELAELVSDASILRMAKKTELYL